MESVVMRTTNFLPLLSIPKCKEYFLESRNFLLAGPLKKVMTLSIPARKELLFTFWATAMVSTGEASKGSS